MKHAFIINPVAGNHKAGAFATQIQAYFKKAGGSFEILVSEYPHHATELTRTLCQTGRPLRIYACGGDGTLFDVVNGAYGYDNAEIGAIPCGAGNDYIKTFGTAQSFLDIEGQVKGAAIPVDLIAYEGVYAINMVSMGMDAEVVHHKQNRRLLSRISGRLAYTVSVFTAFLVNFRNRLTITVDDNPPVTGEFLFAVGANGRFYGSGFQPTPHACPTDGLMEIMLVHSLSRLRVPFLMPKYRAGTHVEMTDLCTTCQGKQFTVEADREITVNLDGEVYRSKKAEFTMIPHGIRFILPSVVTAKDPESETLKSAGVLSKTARAALEKKTES